MRPIVLLLVVVTAASAQIVVVDPVSNASLGQMLLLPDAPVNDYETKVIAVENTGSAPATVNSAIVTGAGFSLCCVSSFTLGPQQSESLTLQFAPTTTGNFTGALEIDDLTVFLYARSIAADSLILQTSAGLIQAHAGTPLVLALDSGFSGQIPCTLQNNSSGPVIVQSVTASGDWAVQNLPPFPLTLQAGVTASFTLAATGNLQSGLSGVIQIGQWVYAIDAHLSTTPIHLSVASPILQSSQQVMLSLNFDAAPSNSTAGTIDLTFDSSTAVSVTDPAILFPSTGTMTAGFNSTPGSTQANFAGNNSIAFQTGTTSGTLHIHAAWGYSEDRIDLTLQAEPVGIETVSAQRQANALQVVVTGFDNTRTAGRMSFSFFDATGAFIGNPVTADFTQSFYNYFFNSAYNAGGMFKMTALFPVTGNPSQVSGVKIDLTNTAGDAQTGVIPFQ